MTFLWLKERASLSRLFHLLEKKQQQKTNLGIGWKRGTFAEYHSSIIVTVSFESWFAKMVLRSIGIVT